MGPEVKKFWIAASEGPIGPFSVADAISQGINGETYVREGEDDVWVEAGNLPDFHELTQPSRAAPMHWDKPKRDMCVKPGYRQYSAILWDIPDGKDWATACYAEPNTINGIFYKSPHRCKQAGPMWGEWDVPDSSCGSPGDINAVAFLVPKEPMNLGHVGWGFRVAPNDWCFGATELSFDQLWNGGLKIEPGKPNGAFSERGTKEKMFERMRTGTRPAGHNGFWPYVAYKPLVANFPDPQKGLAAVAACKNRGYWVNGNNCMDHSVTILNAYSAIPLVPQPSSFVAFWVPNFWFKAVNAQEYETATHPF